jgi:hypothetical protein
VEVLHLGVVIASECDSRSVSPVALASQICLI